MNKKINESELLSEQEDMGLGVGEEGKLEHTHAGNVAFSKAMLEVMPEEEVSQEVKDKNPFQYKYEVKVKKVPKKFKHVAGLEPGIVGRVVEVLSDKAVMVDFWTKTSPAKFPMRTLYLDLHKTREEVELEAGVVPDLKETEKSLAINTLNRGTPNAPVKFDQGKPRMDLIRPEFTMALGQALAYGANKYSEEIGTTPNYLRGDGFNYSKIIGSLERHIAEWKMGNDYDVGESDLHHLALATANLMFLLTYELTDKGVDDRVSLAGRKKVKREQKRAKKGL